VTHPKAGRLLRQAEEARREKRLDDARRDLVAAVALCRSAGAPGELARMLKALGRIERDRGELEEARSLYEEAVGVYRGLDDPLALAHTVRHLGDVHREAGRPELAGPCYDEALSLYRSHDEATPLDLANAVRSLAVLKDGTGDVAEARRLWGEAKRLYREVGVSEGVAECSARLGGRSR
jgi:tetratricopeptide (TPR) repeat protein